MDEPEDGKPAKIVLWSEQDVERYRTLAREIAADPSRIEQYGAEDFMTQTVLLGETAKRMLTAAGSQERVMDIFRLAVGGAKLHVEWREMALPVIKRLLGAGKPNGRRRPPEQIPAACGPRAGSERPG